jgi:hypothetical protein
MFKSRLVKLCCWLLVVFYTQLKAQTASSATRVPRGSSTHVQNTVAGQEHLCVNKKFAIVFWVIPDSAGVICCGTVTLSIPLLMQALNQMFAPICVSFENCAIKTIPFWENKHWDLIGVTPVMTGTYYMDKTINIYMPAVMTNGNANDMACSTFPPPDLNHNYKDAIIIGMTSLFNDQQGGAWLQGNPQGYLAHVMGHYFGLPHTFDEINPSTPAVPPPPASQTASHEWATRVNGNCYTHGDGFCDTEADPFPYLGPQVNRRYFEKKCGGFKYDTKDGKGDLYFPPVDNYMSLYGSCRCRFTKEQYSAMAKFIKANRMDLH